MLQSGVKEKEMLTLMQISELKILVVFVIGSFFMFKESFFNHRLVKDSVFFVFKFVNQSANVFSDLLAFVAFELLRLVLVVLASVIPTVFALVSSISGSVGQRFLVAVFNAMSALLAVEAESLFHEILAFFGAKSIYNCVDVHGHGIAIVLRLVSIRLSALGTFGGSGVVISSHHLGLTPVVVESDCLRHPSGKRSRSRFSHQDSGAHFRVKCTSVSVDQQGLVAADCYVCCRNNCGGRPGESSPSNEKSEFGV